MKSGSLFWKCHDPPTSEESRVAVAGRKKERTRDRVREKERRDGLTACPKCFPRGEEEAGMETWPDSCIRKINTRFITSHQKAHPVTQLKINGGHLRVNIKTKTIAEEIGNQHYITRKEKKKKNTQKKVILKH